MFLKISNFSNKSENYIPKHTLLPIAINQKCILDIFQKLVPLCSQAPKLFSFIIKKKVLHYFKIFFK